MNALFSTAWLLLLFGKLTMSLDTQNHTPFFVILHIGFHFLSGAKTTSDFENIGSLQGATTTTTTNKYHSSGTWQAHRREFEGGSPKTKEKKAKDHTHIFGYSGQRVNLLEVIL